MEKHRSRQIWGPRAPSAEDQQTDVSSEEPTCRLSAFLARPRSVSLRQDVNSCWEAVSVPNRTFRVQSNEETSSRDTGETGTTQSRDRTDFACSLWQLLEVLQQLGLLLGQLRHGLLPLLLGLSSHLALEESLEKLAVLEEGWLKTGPDQSAGTCYQCIIT